MKMLFAIVQDKDIKALTRELVLHDIHVTRIATTGGFLRGGNSTLMIGVEKNRLQQTLDILKEKTMRRKVMMPVSGAFHGAEGAPTPIQVTVGGAIVFVLDVEQFEKF